jgi:xanthine dehydrogenase accessory factor
VREVLPVLAEWHAAGRPAALATVVRTFHSAPRPVGAAMAIAADGTVVGSVSGGCVEGAVYAAALDVISSGVPRLESYGVSDDDAFAAGLPCGGTIDVFIEPLSDASFPELPTVSVAVADAQPVVLATVTQGIERVGGHLVVSANGVGGSVGDADLDQAVASDARAMLSRGDTAERSYPSSVAQPDGDVVVLLQSFAPAPRIYVFGAIELAADLARIGKLLGYHVTVCDAREAFAAPERFPAADEVVVDWPHRFLGTAVVDERTVICVLTHDAKFDVPLLQVALRTPAAYIGVMGSRRTHADRVRRLRELGVADPDLQRLAAPIGLDIGARRPAEMAVAVAAEFIARSRGGSGRSLADTTGAIHEPRPAAGEQAR